MAPKKRKGSQGEASTSSTPTIVDLNVAFGNNTMRTRFITLKKRTLLATKFPDLPTLNQLGLYQGVYKTLNKVGLAGMLEKGAITWKRPTIEFLASMQRTMKEGELAISFQLMGRKFILSYTEVAQALGWCVGNSNWDFPTDMVASIMWFNLTSLHFVGTGGNKINSILHPCLRYVFRLLNQTIFGNGEVGQVTLSELKRFWPLIPEGQGTPPWVEFFVAKCEVEQGKSSGKISFGGLISLLGAHLGVDFDDACGHVQPTGGISFDMPTLRKLSFLHYTSGPRGQCHYLVRGVQGPQFPPVPPTRFEIPDHTTTYNLLAQFMPWFNEDDLQGGGGQQEEEEENVSGDEEYVPEMEEHEHEGMPPSDSWRPYFDEQFSAIGNRFDSRFQGLQDDIGSMRADFQAFRGVMDTRWESLDAQFARLSTFQDSMMGYFNRPQFQDPNEVARLEAQRQADWRRVHGGQQFPPHDDSQDYPGSGPGSTDF